MFKKVYRLLNALKTRQIFLADNKPSCFNTFFNIII